MDRLKSRKFWVTIVTAAIVAVSKDLGIDPDSVLYLCGVVSTYLAGQSYVDRASAMPHVANLHLPFLDTPAKSNAEQIEKVRKLGSQIAEAEAEGEGDASER